MAVLKNKRSPNPLQYEQVFNRLYDTSRERIARIPKRRWKLVAEPLLDCLNPAYIAVMGIAYDPVKGRKDYMDVKYRCNKRAVDLLLAMQKPLYIYWAISDGKSEPLMHKRDDDNRKAWADQVNHTINILMDILRKNPNYSEADDVPPNPIAYYTNKELHSSLLLQATRDLLITTQSEAIRLPLGMRDAQGMILAELMGDAWYHAVEANRRTPRNHEEYDRRREHVSAIISDITESNRAMLAVFTGGTVSEERMAKWANQLKEANDLAYRIQVSDRKRFGNLK